MREIARCKRADRATERLEQRLDGDRMTDREFLRIVQRRLRIA